MVISEHDQVDDGASRIVSAEALSPYLKHSIGYVLLNEFWLRTFLVVETVISTKLNFWNHLSTTNTGCHRLEGKSIFQHTLFDQYRSKGPVKNGTDRIGRTS